LKIIFNFFYSCSDKMGASQSNQTNQKLDNIENEAIKKQQAIILNAVQTVMGLNLEMIESKLKKAGLTDVQVERLKTLPPDVIKTLINDYEQKQKSFMQVIKNTLAQNEPMPLTPDVLQALPPKARQFTQQQLNNVKKEAQMKTQKVLAQSNGQPVSTQIVTAQAAIPTAVAAAADAASAAADPNVTPQVLQQKAEKAAATVQKAKQAAQAAVVQTQKDLENAAQKASQNPTTANMDAVLQAQSQKQKAARLLKQVAAASIMATTAKQQAKADQQKQATAGQQAK
jgi:hypothetical protein